MEHYIRFGPLVPHIYIFLEVVVMQLNGEVPSYAGRAKSAYEWRPLVNC